MRVVEVGVADAGIADVDLDVVRPEIAALDFRGLERWYGPQVQCALTVIMRCSSPSVRAGAHVAGLRSLLIRSHQA
jgi:hypothetical protein